MAGPRTINKETIRIGLMQIRVDAYLAHIAEVDP